MVGVCGCSPDHDPDETALLAVDRIIGEVGTFPGQMSYPRAMDFDGRYLWIVDKTARVQRFDPVSGRSAGGWTMPEYLLGKPTGITFAIGPDGEPSVYIPDTHYHRVIVHRIPPVPADGTTPRQAFLAGQPPEVTRFGSYGEGRGQFIYPTDVALLTDPSGQRVRRVYVSEYGGNDRVSVWEPDGSGGFVPAFSFGVFGSSESADRIEFNRPQSIEIGPGPDGTTELVVADACNHRIGRFTIDGDLIAWIGSPGTAGDAAGSFKYPYGVHVVGDGTALVAEFGNNRVQRIDLRTGSGLGSYGGAGRRPGNLINPWAVTSWGSDVFVLDSQNNRVVVARLPGVKSRRTVAGAGR